MKVGSGLMSYDAESEASLKSEKTCLGNHTVEVALAAFRVSRGVTNTLRSSFHSPTLRVLTPRSAALLPARSLSTVFSPLLIAGHLVLHCYYTSAHSLKMDGWRELAGREEGD